MTIEELISQINTLEMQLEQLKLNSNTLLGSADDNFRKGEYLIAFITQSLVIEQILKQYAIKRLLPVVSQSDYLKKSFNSFHSAKISRLIDDLLIANKIKSELYDKIICYLDKRNDVIHHPEKYMDRQKKEFTDLRTKFELGSEIINSIKLEKIIDTKLISIEKFLERIAELQTELLTLDNKK